MVYSLKKFRVAVIVYFINREGEIMPRNYFICKQCGTKYISYRDKSDYCSIDCRKAARPRIMYNCDYCGTEFRITQNKLDSLQAGKRKHLYCSRECADKGQITKTTKLCEWCGKEFDVSNCFKDEARFCSRECYNSYGHRPNYCKHCGSPFDASKHRDATYCSRECEVADLYPDKIECQCTYCNTTFYVTQSVFDSSQRHYCSKECFYEDISWSEEDKEILRKWYGIKSNYEISQMLSKDYSAAAVKSAANRYGIKIRERWTDEEKEYVRTHYENTPFEVIQSHLSNRSKFAIMGVAHLLNLKSYSYYNSIWSDEDEKTLIELYPTTKTRDLAKRLHKSKNAVVQHANVLGIFKDKRVGECYTSLATYIRGQNAAYHLRKLKDNNFVCQITGKERDVVLHHIYGFSLILAEALEITNIPVKTYFSEYTIEELREIYDVFAELQDFYDNTICIHKDVHVKFHNEYGYGNNTPAQWTEFLNKYYNN